MERVMSEDIEILIVEDSLVQAAYLQDMLEQHSYHVSVAHNGKEALASIEKHKPSIVISDIIMPEMDGYELCRRIRADEDLKDIPVILLTQLSDPKDVITGLECGADNFVTKPYSEGFLLSRIQYVLMNQELRKGIVTEEAIEIFFANQKYSITSDRVQILDLLLSTYEAAVHKNQELEQANEDLKKALETIRSLEANHRTLLERNADAIVVVDQDGVMRFVNPAAEALFGRKAEELLGELFDFPVVAGQTTEVSVVRSSGEAAVAEVRVVETNWEGENVYLASLRDITERKRTEEALRESVEREAQAYAQGRLEIVDTILHNW
jgi:two-component system cell cycle response regulator